MRRSITYAELILILILVPATFVGVQKLHGFIADRISIEVKWK